MKAFEAKEKTSKNEYEAIMKSIENATTHSESKIRYTGTGIVRNTINRLLDDGYDVTITCFVEREVYETIISWHYAIEGQKGKLVERTREQALKELDKSYELLPLTALMKSVDESGKMPNFRPPFMPNPVIDGCGNVDFEDMMSELFGGVFERISNDDKADKRGQVFHMCDGEGNDCNDDDTYDYSDCAKNPEDAGVNGDNSVNVNENENNDTAEE